MDNEPKKVVYLDADEHKALQLLAEMEHRGLGAEVAWLVARELRLVMGVDPDTLQPLHGSERQ